MLMAVVFVCPSVGGRVDLAISHSYIAQTPNVFFHLSECGSVEVLPPLKLTADTHIALSTVHEALL